MAKKAVSGKQVTCANCGWTWSTNDSSPSDKYICHSCGKDNENATLKNGGWLNDYPEAQNGIEGTMGGLTDEGFDYNGAWGGTMQTGGSLPGATGMMYARIGAPSNGPYAKKTKASAENGMEMKYWQEGLDWKPKTISKNGSWLEKYQDEGPLSKEVNYMKNYLSSPMYLERLKKMAGTEKNLQGVSRGKYSSELFRGSDVIEPLEKVAKKSADYSKQALKDISKNIKVGDFNLGNKVAGAYDSSYHDIRLREDLYKLDPTVGIHELSHATIKGSEPYTTAFHEKYLKPLLKEPGTVGWEPYVQKPTEVKARLDALRFLAKEKGIYDPGKQKFTEEHFNKIINDPKIKKDFNYKQLKDQFKKGKEKSGLIWMMNNIAKLESDQSELPLAENGTIIEDPMGQWAHPGEITRIPSNQITMQGVDYPVLGISDTGDTQMMYPEQEYQFNGESVTEIPIMQKGGKVKDPGYSEPDYVTGTSRRAINKMIGMGNYLVPANVLNQATDLAKLEGYGYGETSEGPLDAVRHASAAASVASRVPVPKLISDYYPNLDKAIRIAASNALGLGYELRNFNPEGFLMDIKNNYEGSLIGSFPGLTDKQRNKMVVNQLVNKKLAVDNPSKKKENGGWLNKYK